MYSQLVFEAGLVNHIFFTLFDLNENSQPANIPFFPLLEKLAEKYDLYGDLSLLNLT